MVDLSLLCRFIISHTKASMELDMMEKKLIHRAKICHSRNESIKYGKKTPISNNVVV